MTQNMILSQSSVEVPKMAARMAVILAATFLFILFLLHLLEPEFDPSWRMISEYALGNYGWMMSLAFFCWGGSLLSLLVALWSSLHTIRGMIARGWLMLIVAALFGAGIFKTNAITEPATSTAHNLHALCGAIVILTFPIVASLISGSLSRNPAWADSKRGLLWGTLLVWFSQFAFFGSIIFSRIINPSAGRVGPEVYLGWPNRFLVVVYILWLVFVALRVARLSRQATGKER
jgi:hypothetical protein